MRLLRKTSVYLPTPPVLLALLGLLALVGTLVFRNAGVYLSPTEPTGSGTLLIEGWVDRKGFAQAVATYRNGRYTRLVTTGGPYFLDCDRDDAGYAAQVAKLARDSGLRDGELAVIRVSNTRGDRTRTAAVATARWLQAQPGLQSSLDVYSEGPHARRSWLVYRRELEPLGMRVGIIAASPDWSTATWWRQSEGVKAVVSEAAGWLWETCCSGAAAKQARI
jgi:hypothetical protein